MASFSGPISSDFLHRSHELCPHPEIFSLNTSTALCKDWPQPRFPSLPNPTPGRGGSHPTSNITAISAVLSVTTSPIPPPHPTPLIVRALEALNFALLPFPTFRQGCQTLQRPEAVGLGLPSHPQLTPTQEMASLYFEPENQEERVTPPWAGTPPPLLRNHTPTALSQ